MDRPGLKNGWLKKEGQTSVPEPPSPTTSTPIPPPPPTKSFVPKPPAPPTSSTPVKSFNSAIPAKSSEPPAKFKFSTPSSSAPPSNPPRTLPTPTTSSIPEPPAPPATSAPAPPPPPAKSAVPNPPRTVVAPSPHAKPTPNPPRSFTASSIPEPPSPPTSVPAPPAPPVKSTIPNPPRTPTSSVPAPPFPPAKVPTKFNPPRTFSTPASSIPEPPSPTTSAPVPPSPPPTTPTKSSIFKPPAKSPVPEPPTPTTSSIPEPPFMPSTAKSSIPEPPFMSNNTSSTTSYTSGVYKDLPSELQKDLEENEPIKLHNLKRIYNALGRNVTLEADIPNIYNQDIDRQYKKQLGTIIYDIYLSKIAIILNKMDDSFKDPFLKQFSANKIIFRINEQTPRNDDYHEFLFENGALVLQCESRNLWVNVDNLGYYEISAIIPSDAAVPAAMMKNLREHESDKSWKLSSISSVLARDITIQVDIEDLYQKIKNDDFAVKNAGDILYRRYLAIITEFVENNVRDEFFKPYLKTAFSSDKIIFRLSEKENRIFIYPKIENSNLVFETNPRWFGEEITQIAQLSTYDLIPTVQRRLSDFPLKFSLILRATEEVRDHHLDEIYRAVGKSVDLEVNLKDFYDKITDPKKKMNLGYMLHEKYLGAISNYITTLCKDAKSKAAFTKAFTSGKIIIRINDKVTGKNCALFENGSFVFQAKSQAFESEEPIKGQRFEEIARLLGRPVRFEFDFKQIYDSITYMEQRVSLGEMICEKQLAACSTYIQTVCANKTSKATFLKGFSGKIVIVVNALCNEKNFALFGGSGAFIFQAKPHRFESPAACYDMEKMSIEDLIAAK